MTIKILKDTIIQYGSFWKLNKKLTEPKRQLPSSEIGKDFLTAIQTAFGQE